MATTAAVLNVLVTANTAGAVGQLTAFEGKLKQTTVTSQKSSTAMSKFGSVAKTGALAGVVALGYGLFKSGQKAAEFEQKMSNLGAVADASGKQMKQLEAQALRLGSATAFSATEAADAQIELAKGGLRVKQILGGGLQASLALAAAGELELGLAAETTVNAMKLFELRGKSSMKVADMLATAANTTTGEVRDFAMALSQGGAVAKQAGYGLNGTVTVLEALAEAGVKNSDAGTSMKAAFVQLLKPTEKQTKLAEQLGIAWLNQNGELKNAKGLSRELITATDGMTKAERAKTFAVLAGTDGFRTLSALYDAGPNKLDKLSDANKRQGTAADTARKKQDNLRGDMEKAGGEVETLAIKIGKKLNPIVRQMTRAFTSAVEVLNNLNVDTSSQAFRRLERRSQGVADAIRTVRVALKVLGPVFDFIKKRIQAFAEGFRGAGQVIRGVVGLVSNLIKGRWSKAWDSAKDIVKGSTKIVVATVKKLTAPLRASFGAIRSLMSRIFGGAWDKVEGIFVSGGNAVIGVVNKIIDAINMIPGVPDIDKIDAISGGGGRRDLSPGGSKVRLGRQRGGPINLGKPSGDSVPALLEKGEYVLNRKAVAAVGKKKLDHLNFNKAARFQTGGGVGVDHTDRMGGILDTAKNAASGAMGLAMKGPNFFIDKLPDPNIPQPFTGVGPYLIKKVTEYMKDKVNPFSAGGGGPLGGGSAMLNKIEQIANSQFGLSTTSGYRPGDGGYHGSNQARDLSNGYATPQELAFGLYAAKTWGKNLTELIHTPMGFGIKNGQRISSYGPEVDADHYDHVHVAVAQLGGLVQKLMYGGPAEHRVVKNVGADLLKHGYDFRSTAGILGNAWREGLWNPSQMEMTGADNGGLWGFTAPPKDMGSLRAFARSKGKPWDDEVVQTHFMMRSGGASIKGAMNSLDTIPQTTKYFMDKYEIPAASTAALDIRTAAAYDASTILRRAGITKPGDGGDDGPSAKELAAAKRKRLIDTRTGKIGELRKAVKQSKTSRGKQGALWDLIRGWGKYGEFSKKEKGHVLDVVRRAASMTNPLGNVSMLSNLAQYMRKKGEVSGDEKLDDGFLERIKKATKKGENRGDRKRKRVWKKLGLKGMNFLYKDSLVDNDNLIARYMEELDIAEQRANLERSPGGSDYTDAEVKQLVWWNENILDVQRSRRSHLNTSIREIMGVKASSQMKMQAVREGLDPSKKWWNKKTLMTVSHYQPRKWMKENAWKYPGWKRAARNADRTLGSKYGGDGLRGNLAQLVGLTGKGGELFDTKMRLADLGATVTVEKEAANAATAGISISDILSIVEASKYNVFDRMPKFHTGGVMPGAGEQPAMLMGGEGVFTREQMAAMGTQGITFEVNFKDERLKDLIDIQVKTSDRKKEQLAKAGVR